MTITRMGIRNLSRMSAVIGAAVLLRLKLKITRKIFRGHLADSLLELKRSMECVIQFFDEHDQRSDVAIPQPRTWIVLFELFDQPAGIVNADIKLVSGTPQKRAREFAQFPGRFAREHRQLRAARPINQTIFQINSDLRVRAFKQSLDLAEECLVHKESEGRASSSRLSNRSDS